MLLFTIGGSMVLDGCSTTRNCPEFSHHPSKERLVPAGTISLPADGIIVGAPKIRSEFTNGQFCCQEVTVQPKYAGPPPHLHKELDEIMYVIEGTASVMVGSAVTEVHAGDYHLRPHGIVHTFWNSGDTPVRFIDMYPNQDFISYFEEFDRIGNKIKSKGLGIDSPESVKMIDDLNQKFGIEVFFEQFPPLLQQYGLKT